MTQQVYSLQNQKENNSQINEQNRFLACEEIVEELIEQGLPKTFSPDGFITKISKTYGISFQEAKTCLKLAIKQLEAQKAQVATSPVQEELYAQSGYFYPQGYNQNNATKKQKDGMDSLSSLGSYNRLMFGLR